MLTRTAGAEALLPVYAQMPLRPVSGHGSWLTAENGDEWLDAYGGHAVASTGHSHPDVVRAIAEQAATFAHLDPALHQLVARSLDVGDHQKRSLDRSGLALS